MKSQIVIPVHDKTRPIARAVNSVLENADAGVIVVAHNVNESELDCPRDPRVLLLTLEGAVGKPGAAFDVGVAAATAKWVGIMGSDDWYEPGALSALIARGEADHADGVIVPLAYQGGGRGVNPRTFRRRKLQAARDRLFYRTAPLGIFRREILQGAEYHFGDEFSVGEDISVSVRLWTSGNRISHYCNDPAYVVGADARERTTLKPMPLHESGAAWLELWNQEMVQRLGTRTKHALAVKILRVHVWGALRARPNVGDWAIGEFEWLSGLTQRVLREDPRAIYPFRRVTARTLTSVASGDLDEALSFLRREREASRIGALMSHNLGALFDSEAPIRWTMLEVLLGIRNRFERFFLDALPKSSEE